MYPYQTTTRNFAGDRRHLENTIAAIKAIESGENTATKIGKAIGESAARVGNVTAMLEQQGYLSKTSFRTPSRGRSRLYTLEGEWENHLATLEAKLQTLVQEKRELTIHLPQQ